MSYLLNTFNNSSLAESNSNGSIAGAVIFCSIGTLGIFVNAIVGIMVKQCELGFATDLIMRSQCAANIIGLIPMTLYSPWLIMRGTLLDLHSFLQWVPGSLFNIGLFINFWLQTMMALNRTVSIGFFKMEPVIFSRRNTKIFWMIGWICMVTYGVAGLFPCCQKYFNPTHRQWEFSGVGLQVGPIGSVYKKVSGLMYILLFLTCLTSHCITLLKMKQYRKAIKNEEISREQGKRELKVFFIFLTTTLVWFLSFSFRLVNHPSVRGTWVTSIAEVQRYILLSADPIVYILSIKQLQEKLSLKKFVHHPNNQVVVAVNVISDP